MGATLLLLVASAMVAAILLLLRSKRRPALEPGDLDLLRKLPQQIMPGRPIREWLRLSDAGFVDTIDVEGDFGPSYLFVLSDRGKQVLSKAD